MNEHHLSAFIIVADCGSISKAAKRLFITPQALSQQMDLIERECNAKLFVRGSNGVSLTQEGRVFYSFAEESLERGQKMLARLAKLKEDRADTIRIGSTVGPPSNMAMSVRHEFFQTHPSYQQEIVDLNILDRLQGLDDDLIDVVEYADSPALKERGFLFKQLALGQLVLMTSAKNPLAATKHASLADLRGQAIQVFDWDFYRHAIDAHPDVGFTQYEHTAPGFSNDFYADILAHCQAGAAFLAVKGSEIYNTQLNLFKIEIIPLDDSIPLGLAYRADSPEAVKEFVDFTALCTASMLI